MRLLNSLDLPQMGVGLGFRAQLQAELFLNQGSIDFLEVTADHFLSEAPEVGRRLSLLREHFPLVPHALGLSLGSVEGLDEAYLDRLAHVVNEIDPPWWSEHVSFTRSRGEEIGHLTPVPRTAAMIDCLARNIEAARKRISAPLILENITYSFEMPGAEMEEHEFLSRLVEVADCGLLLDVTNLHVNAVNHGLDIEEFLDSLPAERVVQLHVAGGHVDGEELIDSHSSAPEEGAWDLLQEVVRRFPVRGAIVERDENIPRLAELILDLDRIRAAGVGAGLPWRRGECPIR